MFGFMRRRHPARRTVRAAVASALVGVSLASVVALPQTADANVLSPIDGSYLFNANGWTGSLVISGAENLSPTVVMAYDELGYSQVLTGTWSPSTRTLTVYRPLSGGVGQSYVLYLGDHVQGAPVFGGYFTESDVPGIRYGAFADDYVSPGVPRPVQHLAGSGLKVANTVAGATIGVAPAGTVHPDISSLPGYLYDIYNFDGNGWEGQMGISSPTCPFPDGMMLDYFALGVQENISISAWDASSGTLTFVRQLSGGATQTYTLYEGTHISPSLVGNPYLSQAVMFGGYFTESDTGSTRYAAYATDLADGGVGC